MAKNKNVPPEVSAFFAEIGRRNGKELMRKHGPDYFKRIAGMRKLHGRQKPKPSEALPESVESTLSS